MSSRTEEAKGSVTILFVPSNPSHVATQLPVARALRANGHRPLFLSRDLLVEEEYRVEPSLASHDMEIVRYPFFYESDLGRLFPRGASYRRFSAECARWLTTVGADAVAVCNDDAALFDRVMVDMFRRQGKPSFLIQESIRPANRRIPLAWKLRELSIGEVVREQMRQVAFRLGLGPFFRKGYAHSSCSRIFAAGAIFRTRLLDEGIAASRVVVTGQPRLDGRLPRRPDPQGGGAERGPRVLLYCNQPVKCSVATQQRLFLDLVQAVDSLEGVRLLVKLHPRDLPESHWTGLLKPGQGSSLLEVTKSRPLADCFAMADAFMTVASTTCLEAMDFGLPVGLIDFLPIEWHLPYGPSGAVLSVESREGLRGVLETLLFDEAERQRLCACAEQVLHQELFQRDGQSGSRIAEGMVDSVRQEFKRHN